MRDYLLHEPYSLTSLDFEGREHLSLHGEIGWGNGGQGLPLPHGFDGGSGRGHASSTNRVFAEWAEVFPNAPSIIALVDRLCHNAEIVSIDADSYRNKETLERNTARKAARLANPDHPDRPHDARTSLAFFVGAPRRYFPPVVSAAEFRRRNYADSDRCLQRRSAWRGRAFLKRHAGSLQAERVRGACGVAE